MNQVVATMPSLLRNEGVWQGRYRLVDSAGRLLDEYNSRIEVRFPADGRTDYPQRNHFTWADGREVQVEHPAMCRAGVLHWDTPHIHGRAWAVDERSTALTWRRQDTHGAEL